MNSVELGKAVVSELLSGGSVWLFLLITALFAGIGAYFGKYLSTKGANLATREDFNSLQEQLRVSTLLVESVKSEIARTDWVAREWAALRIKKIEELTTTLHACEAYLRTKRDASIDCRYYPETPPFDQGIMISELYLPELVDIVSRFVQKCRKLDIAMSELARQGLETKQEGKQYDASLVWGNFFEKSEYQELHYIFSEIRTAARQLLQEIMMDKELKGSELKELASQ